MGTTLIRVNKKSVDVHIAKIKKELGISTLQNKEITEKALEYASNNVAKVFK